MAYGTPRKAAAETIANKTIAIRHPRNRRKPAPAREVFGRGMGVVVVGVTGPGPGDGRSGPGIRGRLSDGDALGAGGGMGIRDGPRAGGRRFIGGAAGLAGSFLAGISGAE